MRLITVPIDKEAEERLYYDQNSEFDVIDVFLNESDYYKLWDSKLFDKINEALDLLIDDYEEETISGKENLEKLHAIIIEYEQVVEDNPLLYTLKSLTEAAIRFDTSVHLFF